MFTEHMTQPAPAPRSGLSAEALFRRAVIAAWERIPVADRPWNQRVADALWADQRFREAMREYVIRAEDEDEGSQMAPPAPAETRPTLAGELRMTSFGRSTMWPRR